jgi:putative flippase GtrA
MFDRLKKSASVISKKGGIFMFIRAQFSSLGASATDYLVSISLAFVFYRLYGENMIVSIPYLFTEQRLPSYIIPNFIGSVFGGFVNCIINYKWTFKANTIKKRYVIVKYLIIWICSILLNNFGTIAVTEMVGKISWIPKYDYLFVVSKVIVSLIVGYIWNYNMQRLFVYRSLNFQKYLLPKKFRKTEKKSLTLAQNSEEKK